MEGGGTDGKMSPRESNNNNGGGGTNGASDSPGKPSLPADPAAFAALAAAAAATGGFPPGFPSPVTSAASSPMFPFPFHPSMLASMASMSSSMQRSRSPQPPPHRAATPPSPKPPQSPRPKEEEEETEQPQKRLRHESSAKDDDAGKSVSHFELSRSGEIIFRLDLAELRRSRICSSEVDFHAFDIFQFIHFR